MAWIGKQYALTASAATLTTALGLTQKLYIRQLNIKNAKLAVNLVYLGPSSVTNAPANAYVELDANQGWTVGAFADRSLLTTDDIYIVGTVNAANIAFIDLTYMLSGA